jgi:DNA replication protein DnaC
MSDCAICGGTGFEIVVRDDREFAKTCACRADASRGPDIFERLRVPARYRGCTLSNFESASSPQMRAAWEKAASFAAGYPHAGVSAGLGLLFTGSNGIGKTHLAVAVLREVGEAKKARGQFWDFHELMREIRSSYNPDVRMTETEVLDPIIKTDILVLDDLGAWKMTDWMNDTLFYILNQRYVHQRPSIITTNFEDREPADIRRMDQSGGDATDREYLVERIGNRLRSRLMEMCVVVKMKGTDHRVHRQHYNQAGALDGGR